MSSTKCTSTCARARACVRESRWCEKSISAGKYRFCRAEFDIKSASNAIRRKAFRFAQRSVRHYQKRNAENWFFSFLLILFATRTLLDTHVSAPLIALLNPERWNMQFWRADSCVANSFFSSDAFFRPKSALKLIGIGKVTNTFSHNHSYDIAIIFNYIWPFIERTVLRRVCARPPPRGCVSAAGFCFPQKFCSTSSSLKSAHSTHCSRWVKMATK